MRQKLAKAKKLGNPKGLKASPPPLGKAHVQRLTPTLAGKNVELFERQTRAVRMAARGATFEQIARALGYSDRGDAHRDVMQALDAVRVECKVEARQLRDLKLSELEGLRFKMHSMLEARDASPKDVFAAVDRLIKIQEREARLLGLDSPTKVEATGAGGKPIQIDVGSITREQLVRLAAGDTSVLYPVGGPTVGQG